MRKYFPLSLRISLHSGLAFLLVCSFYLLFAETHLASKPMIMRNLTVIVLAAVGFIHMGLFLREIENRIPLWIFLPLADLFILFTVLIDHFSSFKRDGILLLVAILLFLISSEFSNKRKNRGWKYRSESITKICSLEEL